MKRVFITGASRGIGKACAEAFGKAGYDIGIGCRDLAAGNAVADKIRRSGGYAVLCPGDVQDPSAVHTSAETMKKSIGIPDCLILSAGVAYQGLFQDTDPDTYDRLMNTNVKGSYLVVREFLPAMIAAHRGNILFISSMWGQVGASCEVLYSASKAAIIGMTKALAKEVGPSGIRVNCLCPGVIETDMTLPLGKETLDSLAEETPLGRNGKPEEIAQAALWISSPEASFLTGQVIGINGGLVI
jgi:3-oxoacyl-[acyl-carrier protein] reductase